MKLTITLEEKNGEYFVGIEGGYQSKANKPMRALFKWKHALLKGIEKYKKRLIDIDHFANVLGVDINTAKEFLEGELSVDNIDENSSTFTVFQPKFPPNKNNN